MEGITLSELINSTKARFVFGDPGQNITNVSTDSRHVRQGDIFFALKGRNFDAHEFTSKAIEKGCSGIVVNKLGDEINRFFPGIPAILIVSDTQRALGDFAAYYRKKLSPVVVGITGSSGKTTTKEILYSILKNKTPTLANTKNFNNLIGVPLTLFNLKKQHKYCIVEIGISMPGEMERLVEITNPDIGIITNIGKTHLEYLKSQESIFQEKSKLLQSLPVKGTAVINLEDPYLAGLKSVLKCNTVTFGMTEKADVNASEIQVLEDKTLFKLKFKNETIDVVFPMPGRFNVLNALAASAASFALGLGSAEIKKGLEECASINEAIGMRMQKIGLKSGALLINDAYNANPDSMRQALSYFVEAFPEKKKIAVLGDMLELGEFSENEHRQLGEFLSGLPFDDIYLSGNMVKYIKGNSNLKNIQYYSDPQEILVRLKQKLNKSTVVLFKASRGMRFENIVNNLLDQ